MNFAANSRYAGSAGAYYTTPDGQVITYVARRVLPPPEIFTPLAWHRLSQSERVDMLAEQYYGDPEQYWRICDANRVYRPADTTTNPDAVLLIPLPLEVASRGDT